MRFKGARYGQAVAVVTQAVAVIGQDVAVTTGRSVRYRRVLRIDTGHNWSVGQWAHARYDARAGRRGESKGSILWAETRVYLRGAGQRNYVRSSEKNKQMLGMHIGRKHKAGRLGTVSAIGAGKLHKMAQASAGLRGSSIAKRYISIVGRPCYGCFPALRSPREAHAKLAQPILPTSSMAVHLFHANPIYPCSEIAIE